MVGIAAALVLTLSSHAAGANGVRIALRATVEMQCGWAGPHIDVVFPATERLPANIGRASVRVNGTLPLLVSRGGRTVSLAIARPSGVICDVMGPGTVSILFTPGARIGNPRRAGTYSLLVEHGASSARGTFSIR